MFNYTSLLGAQSASLATQSILELDGGIKILVDIGWDESLDSRMLLELEKYEPSVARSLQLGLNNATGTSLRFPSYS